MSTYIHERSDWPTFRWDKDAIAKALADVRHAQGRLVGRMQALGLGLQAEAVLGTLTEDVLKTTEIEGERLDRDDVRSSIARHMGLDIGALPKSDRNVEGIVEMMLDATTRYAEPLTPHRLKDWHASLFPTARSGMRRIIAGDWRDDESGPMQVVSGPFGAERVHFEAPAAARLDAEIAAFCAWFNADASLDDVLKAALAHLWFVTLHPFDDGNGRVARAIADLALARSERSPQRFYSMSSAIRAERRAYYAVLEATQAGDLDVTRWLLWFFARMASAIAQADDLLGGVLTKARVWDRLAGASLNPRQRDILNRLLDGFDGALTTSKWAKIQKCSQDTALRDIEDLIGKGVLRKEEAGGRSTRYGVVLKQVPDQIWKS